MSIAGKVRGLRTELATPLFRNAYALMLNTAVNSVFGLLYWIVAARTFTDAEVGRGSALISLMMLVSTLTQLNFGQALIRFLPRAGTSSQRLLRSAYGISAGLAVLGSTAVMAYCALVLPESDPLHVSLPFAGWFILSTTLWSLFTLQDATLTGLRAAIWIPLENGIYGIVKLVLLVIVAQTSLANGVFISWTLPVVALLVPVTLLVFRRLLPRHAEEGTAEQKPPTRRVLRNYMAGDYTGQVFNQLASTFLPVLVVSELGPEAGAYFLPAQTVFVAMNLLAQGITSSLVVEAARDESRTHVYAMAILRRISATVLPAAVVIAVAAPLLLQLFGSQYRANSTFLLQLLMASTFPRVVVTLFMTRSRMQNRTINLAILQFVQAAALIGGTVLFADSLGLDAVGWSALGIELAMALVLLPAVVRWLRPTVPAA